MRYLFGSRPNKRYVILRQDLLEFCEGDACAAMILYLLEWWVGVEMDKLEHEGVTEGLIWLPLSIPAFEKGLLGQYSRNVVRAAVDLLEVKGLIVAAKETGKVKRVALNHQGVAKCLQEGTSIGCLPDQIKIDRVQEGLIPPNQNWTGDQIKIDRVTRSKLIGSAGSPPYYVLKEEKEEKTYPPSSLETKTEPQATSTPRDIAYSYQDGGADGDFPAEEPPERPPRPASRFRRKLKPPPDPNSASARLRRMRENALPEPVAASEWASPTPNTPQSNQEVPRPQERDFVQEWNRIVTSRPHEELRKGTRPRAYTEPAFAANWEKVCQKAQAINQAGVSITFVQMLHRDSVTDQYGFELLLAGKYDWALNNAGKSNKNNTRTQAEIDRVYNEAMAILRAENAANQKPR